MFNVVVLDVDHRCINNSIARGASYENCARRASSRVLVKFIHEMFPQTSFGRKFLDKLTAYVMDITHSGVTTPDVTRKTLFSLLEGNERRHADFKRILRAGVARAQDITEVPGSVADESRPTRTPIELQFQAMANAVVIQVLETLLMEVTKYKA